MPRAYLRGPPGLPGKALSSDKKRHRTQNKRKEEEKEGQKGGEKRKMRRREEKGRKKERNIHKEYKKSYRNAGPFSVRHTWLWDTAFKGEVPPPSLANTPLQTADYQLQMTDSILVLQTMN